VKGIVIVKMYRNCEAAKQFVSAIAMVEKSKVADEIKDVNFISILSDGSINSSITEHVLFFLLYVANGTPIVRFVASIQVETGDSISIFKAIQKALKLFGNTIHFGFAKTGWFGVWLCICHD